MIPIFTNLILRFFQFCVQSLDFFVRFFFEESEFFLMLFLESGHLQLGLVQFSQCLIKMLSGPAKLLFFLLSKLISITGGFENLIYLNSRLLIVFSFKISQKGIHYSTVFKEHMKTLPKYGRFTHFGCHFGHHFFGNF